jgi:hypothetical protein
VRLRGLSNNLGEVFPILSVLARSVDLFDAGLPRQAQRGGATQSPIWPRVMFSGDATARRCYRTGRHGDWIVRSIPRSRPCLRP